MRSPSAPSVYNNPAVPLLESTASSFQHIIAQHVTVQPVSEP